MLESPKWELFAHMWDIQNDWDIRLSVAVKALSANISWMAKLIYTIELVLESAQHSIPNDIWCVSKYW